MAPPQQRQPACMYSRSRYEVGQERFSASLTPATTSEHHGCLIVKLGRMSWRYGLLGVVLPGTWAGAGRRKSRGRVLNPRDYLTNDTNGRSHARSRGKFRPIRRRSGPASSRLAT